jgi:para-nitrobenzyl esterase
MTPRPVDIETGRLAGAEPDANGVRAFKGIPYAAPPVGPLRWRPPQPAAKWNDIRASDKFAANAPQRVVFADIDPFAVGVSEDCLYLNVWTSAAPGKEDKLPVLFYIHGGGFAVGAGSEPRYDGARLAAKGIVVVTVNYRLNALGLLAHPALTAETGSSGNFALLDLIAALQWVKRNIAALGGSPDAVTISGESAGSMYVSLLMASPLSRGLFHRAIGQSGAQFPSPERPMLSLKAAEELGRGFAGMLKAKTADDLRAASVDAILDAHPGVGFWPIVDSHVISETPAQIFAKGLQADVPLLAGWTRDEGTNFNVMNWPIAGEGYEKLLQVLFASHWKDVLALYPAGRKTKQSANALGGDLVIIHSTWAWLESHRATGKADIFRYRFDRTPNVPASWIENDKAPGAFHSCDIPYFMDTLDALPWFYEKVDREVADLTSDYVVNFVKNSNPNGEGLPAWPSYRDGKRPSLHIDAKTSIGFDEDRPRQELLARLLS